MNFIYGLVHFNLILSIMAINQTLSNTQLAVNASQLPGSDKPDNTPKNKNHVDTITTRNIKNTEDLPKNFEWKIQTAAPMVTNSRKLIAVNWPNSNPTTETVPENQAVFFNWQFLTILQFDSGIKTLFAGVLIKSNIVLTVAQYWEIQDKNPGVNLEVVFDIFHVNQKNIMKTISRAVHPEFHYMETFGPVNDIAVIKLQSSVYKFHPVPLPEYWMELEDQTQCVTIGHILNNTHRVVVELAQMVTSCTNNISPVPVNSQICTLFVNKARSLEFFRGTPLMCEGFLYGLFSHGPHYTNFSSETAFMVWTRLGTYFPWVSSTVKRNVPLLNPEHRQHFEEENIPVIDHLDEERLNSDDFLNRTYEEGMIRSTTSGNHPINLLALWATGLFVNLF